MLYCSFFSVNVASDAAGERYSGRKDGSLLSVSTPQPLRLRDLSVEAATDNLATTQLTRLPRFP